VSVRKSRIERDNAREIIFVKENIIVGRFTRAEQTRVTVEIVIKLDWADNVRVYNRAREAVIVLVAIGIRNREENNFVVFANDNESNCGIKIKFIACLCRFVGDGEEAEVGEIIRNTNTTRNAGTDAPRMRRSSSLIIVLNSPSETPS
jgi:hypothetical protein